MRTKRWTLAAILFALLVLLAVAPSPGQCVLDSSGYVYLHPHFAGKAWSASLADTDVILPDEICNLKPQTVAYSNNDSNDVMVFRAQAGTLHGSSLITYGPSCYCCKYEIDYGLPTAISISGASMQTGSPLYIFKERNFPNGRFKLLMASVSGRALLSVTVNATGFAQMSMDSLQLSGAAQHITFIGGDPDSVRVNDRGLWIGGSGRMLRYFPYSAGAFGAEQVFDVAGNDTIMSVGAGYAGGWSGTLYRRNGNAFTQENRLTVSPLRSVSDRAAVGDAGTVMVRLASGWYRYGFGTRNYRYFNLIPTGDGSAAELLNDRWSYSLSVYADSQTYLKRITPAVLDSFVNGLVYQDSGNGRTSSIRIVVGDRDSNDAAPQVRVRTRAGVHNLNFDSAHSLIKREPNAACAEGKLVFADTVVTISLVSGIATYNASARLGKIDLSCSRCVWSNYAFSTTAAYATGDTLVVHAGKDSLRIRLYNGPATIASNPMNSARSTTILRIGKTAIPMPVNSSRLTAISIVDARGRIVARLDPAIIQTLPRLPAGLLMVVCHFSDGVVRQVRMPVVK
jgi:hypothetical protein